MALIRRLFGVTSHPPQRRREDHTRGRDCVASDEQSEADKDEIKRGLHDAARRLHVIEWQHQAETLRRPDQT